MKSLDIKELASYGCVKIYRKGEILRCQGDPIDEVLILLEGLIRTEYVSEEGKSLEVDLISPVRIIASGLIFSRKAKFPVNLIVKEDAKILEIPKEKLFDILMIDRDLLKFFLEDISEHFRIVSEKLFLLTTKKLREKLIHYLIKHANENNEVTLPVNIEELSKLFGCTRPALSRVFGELMKEGVIEKHGKKIKLRVIDPDFEP